MNWEHPSWLLLWWLLPGVAGLLVYAHRKQRAAAENFAEPSRLPNLIPAAGRTRSVLRAMAFLTGLALLITGLARPRWGVYFEKVQSRGVDLFVLLDVSRSMLADDVTPSRLERAKSDIRDLLPYLTSDRVGLVVFAGAAVVAVPLTTDQGFFLSALEEVGPGSAPRGGSLIGDAIRKSLESLEPRADRDQVLVLITDGEDHDSFPGEAAKQAAERAVKIFTVGLGDTEEGRRIPVRDDRGGSSFLKQDGQEVWSKMDEKLLQEIAVTTGGAYIPAKTRAYDLGEIYRDHLAQLTRGEIATEKRKRYGERFQIFLVLGFVLLLFELLVPRYNSRWTDMKNTPFLLLLLLILANITAPLFSAEREVIRHVAQGIDKHRARDFKGAEQEFAAAAKLEPEDPRITFDHACALAAQGKHEEAEKLFGQTKLARNKILSSGSLYNLGCLAAARAKAKLGEHPEDAGADERTKSLKDVEQAVAHYRACLSVDPSHSAARHNLELLRLWVKHIQEVWRQRDRDKRRQELKLLEFLEMVQGEQVALREQTRSLFSTADSPRRRQAATMLGQLQRELGEEIGPLRQKLEAELFPQTPDPTSPPPASVEPPAELAQALAALTSLAQEAQNLMAQASVDLATNHLAPAEESQTQSLEPLNHIYQAIAPFEHVLRKAIQVQERLMATTQERTDAKPEPSPSAKGTPGPGTTPQGEFDPARDLPTEQRRIAGWAGILKPKAEQSAAALKSQPAVAGPPPPPGSTASSSDPDPIAQREALLAAYAKATELGPQAEAAAQEAAKQLDQHAWPGAQAKEEETLKLLQEIANQLPKQPNQDQPDQKEPNQDQQDEKKPDAPKPSPQDSEQSDKSQKDQEKPPQAPSKSKEQQQQDRSRQQAEANLRQVRERERNYHEEKKKRQAVIGGVRVNKDW